MNTGQSSPQDLSRGLWWGTVGVLIFALTLPMTRLAVGPQDAPQLPPLFVTAGRAAGAGLLSVVYLIWTQARRPHADEWPSLLLSAVGTVLGFPLCLALALREVPAMHAAVVTGILPLATAMVAAVALRQRASVGFWLCATLGCGLVLAFAALEGGGRWVAADGWLLLAVLSAAMGYVAGAKLTRQWQAEQVICWVLVLSLPLSLPLAWWVWPQAQASAAAWGGFAYVTVFSMWLGFFAWYRGLAWGGMMRVSQIQLIQPFAALMFAAWILHEPLSGHTVGFALAIIAVVLVGKRMPVEASPKKDTP